MEYEHAWAIEGHVIQTRVWGKSDVKVIANMISDGFTQFYDVSQKPIVHHAICVRGVIGIPNLGELVAAVPKKPHPRAGWAIIITNDSLINQLLRFIFLMTTSVSNVRYRQVFNENEAWATIKEIDSLVDWSKQINHDFLTLKQP